MSNQSSFGIRFEEVAAGDIFPGGIFVWGSGMYETLSKPDDQDKMSVRQIAAGWTSNPNDRWQSGKYIPEIFQADCPVRQLIFVPTETKQ